MIDMVYLVLAEIFLEERDSESRSGVLGRRFRRSCWREAFGAASLARLTNAWDSVSEPIRPSKSGMTIVGAVASSASLTTTNVCRAWHGRMELGSSRRPDDLGADVTADAGVLSG